MNQRVGFTPSCLFGVGSPRTVPTVIVSSCPLASRYYRESVEGCDGTGRPRAQLAQQRGLVMDRASVALVLSLAARQCALHCLAMLNRWLTALRWRFWITMRGSLLSRAVMAEVTQAALYKLIYPVQTALRGLSECFLSSLSFVSAAFNSLVECLLQWVTTLGL